MGVLVDRFSDGMGAGFRETICQQSGVIGKWIEFYNGEVPFRERPSLVEQNCVCSPCVLNRSDGLVSTRRKAR